MSSDQPGPYPPQQGQPGYPPQGRPATRPWPADAGCPRWVRPRHTHLSERTARNSGSRPDRRWRAGAPSPGHLIDMLYQMPAMVLMVGISSP
jgi:hypothetical protein